MPINTMDEQKIDELIKDSAVNEFYKKSFTVTDKSDKLLSEILNMPHTSDPSIHKKIIIKNLRKQKNYKEIENLIFREKSKLLSSFAQKSHP